VALGGISHSHRPATGLRSHYFHLGIGECVAGIFVEYQIAGLQVDRILDFLRRGLVRAGHPGRVGDQIDLDLPVCSYVSGFLVVSKILAVDLIESRGVGPVEDDVDVVQFGIAVQLELLDAAGLYGE
jgi:hypothetical protein